MIDIHSFNFQDILSWDYQWQVTFSSKHSASIFHNRLQSVSCFKKIILIQQVLIAELLYARDCCLMWMTWRWSKTFLVCKDLCFCTDNCNKVEGMCSTLNAVQVSRGIKEWRWRNSSLPSKRILGWSLNRWFAPRSCVHVTFLWI